MTTDHLAALRELTSFTVTVHYRVDETALDVHPPRSSRPVARMVKKGAIRTRAAYQLFVGPDLNIPDGQITASGAQAADSTPIGIINLSGGRVPDGNIHPMSGARHTYVVHNPARWRLSQVGLPTLAGKAVGRGTRMCFNRVTDLSERTGFDLPVPDFFLPMTFRYGGPGGAGFTVTRPARRARFDVDVDDPRIDRRMILACVAAVTALTTWTPQTELADIAHTFRP